MNYAFGPDHITVFSINHQKYYFSSCNLNHSWFLIQEKMPCDISTWSGMVDGTAVKRQGQEFIVTKHIYHSEDEQSQRVGLLPLLNAL